jgi:hypothetical protein
MSNETGGGPGPEQQGAWEAAERFHEQLLAGKEPDPTEAAGGDQALTEDLVLIGRLHEMGREAVAAPAGADDWPVTRPLADRYVLTNKLGAGGMGVVYQAEDLELDRAVAVKVLRNASAADQKALERFRREPKLLARVNHPNIVTVYDVGQTAEGIYYLVMELVEGGSAQDLVDGRKPRDWRRATEILRDACLGLEAVHDAQMLHRDIKPANILLTGSGRAKLADFGLAKATDGTGSALSAGNAVCGTFLFMSPEQMSGQPERRSDIYALGLSYYAMLAGRPPATRRALDTQGLPAGCAAIVRRATDAQPERRFQTVAEMRAALEGLLQPTPSQAAPWHPLALTGRHGRRTLLIAGGVIVLAAAVAGWRLTRPPPHGVAPNRVALDTPGTSRTEALPPAPVHYRGQVDVLVERAGPDGAVRLLRLHEPGALPLRKDDKFRVEGRVEPAAYLYVVWVDPGHDVTPVYPWDPRVGWGSRPAKEEMVGRVSLPPNAGNKYTAPDAKAGVATMMLFARPTPLDSPDEVVRSWFEGLPDLPLPPGGEQAAVWFDDYVEVRNSDRPRTFGEVGSNDPFARWQGQLQKVIGEKAVFETAVSFARMAGK